MKLIWALLRQRCPICFEGRIYERGMNVHERCPKCNVLFARGEPGYFVGSMYISYGLATVFLVTVFFIVHFMMPERDLVWPIVIAAIIFVPFVPVTTRYARVIWMYLDRWMWPQQPGE